MSESAVRLEAVRKVYDRGRVAVEALRGVDLSIAPGEMVAITGPSGSGKSTCLHLAGALDVPSDGRVLVLGHDTGALGDDALSAFRRRRLGFVFQFFNLLPTLSAVENAALPLLLDGHPRKDALRRGAALLERTGLGARLEHRPDELSGGQQQRVALARALVHEPALLLADEPTGNLDSEAGKQVLDLIDEARAARGLTVVLVTHDPAIAARADREVRLHDGRIEEDRRRPSGRAPGPPGGPAANPAPGAPPHERGAAPASVGEGAPAAPPPGPERVRAVVRGVALRRVVLEPGRTALLVLGVALGVAVLVAVRGLNGAALGSLDRLGQVATGNAAFLVEGGAAGVPRDLAATLRALPGVARASPLLARSAREALGPTPAGPAGASPPGPSPARDPARAAAGDAGASAAGAGAGAAGPAGPADGPDPERAFGAADMDTRRVLVLGVDLAGEIARLGAGPGADPAGGPAGAAAGAPGGLTAGAGAGSIAAELGLALDPRALARARAPVVVSRALAARRGLRPGSSLRLYLARGQTAFDVVGLFEPTGAAAQASGGEVVVMDLAQAAAAFGTPDRCDRVAVELAPGADAEAVAAALRAAAGPGLDVRTPGQAAGFDTGSLLGTMQLALELASWLGLVIGQFLIYNATSIAVVRRRPELGILRALGATRRQVVTLLLVEAACYGLVGAALGLGIGWGLANLARGVVSAQVSQLYAVLDLRAVPLTPSLVAWALCAGPLATVLAAIPPVASTVRVAPVEATRKEPPARAAGRGILALAALGALLLAGSVAAWAATGALGLVGGALLVVAVAGGGALCAPLLALLLLRALRPALAGLGPVGALAAEEATARPGRTGVTVAALVVALAGTLAIAGLVTSLERSVRDWVKTVLTADIYCAASSPLGSQANTLLDVGLLEEVAAVPGVRAAYPIRTVFERARTRRPDGTADERPVLIFALEMGFLGSETNVPIGEPIPGGLPAAMSAIEADAGDCVAVSANLARARGLAVGDRVTVRTPGGDWSPRIVVTIIDYTSEHGCVYVHWPEYVRRWGDRRANAVDVFLRQGASEAEVEALAGELRRRFGARYDLFVTANAAFRAQVQGVIESAFTVTWAMQVVALGIALLGLVTTLFASTLERTRDLGVLRAVGATRGQVARTVVLEAALLGLLSAALATPLGAWMGQLLVDRVIRGAYGWELELHHPWVHVGLGLVVAPALAALAGLLPAARAGRVEVVEALSYD